MNRSRKIWHPLVAASCLTAVACTAPTMPRTGLEHIIERNERAPVAPPQIAPTIQRRLESIHAADTPTGVSRVADATLDARLLVLSADGQEPSLKAIKQALDYQGTPYEMWVAKDRPGQLTADRLASGNAGRYQGVILATGNLGMADATGNWVSALTNAEWQALYAYEAAFGVRQAVWYAYPTPDLGFGASQARGVGEEALEARLTTEGAAVFGYLSPGATIPLRHTWVYMPERVDATTTPLIEDAAGRPLAVVKRYDDGREALTMTFDSNPHLVHGVTLAYGLVNWVTRGLFLGERHVYVGAQVDDVFLGTEIWNQGGKTYRMTGADLRAALAWQQAQQRDPLLAGLTLDLAFNGYGTIAEEYKPDSLTPVAREVQDQFKWISHTFTHLNLDNASYRTSFFEFQANNLVAHGLKLSRFNPANIVTPEISGLKNPEAMRAAHDAGIRFLVSDTSYADQANPSPNAGLLNWSQPGVLMIPRRPTNLYYNVSTPAEWTDMYNWMYRTYWGRDLSYAEVLDKESQMLLMYLLKGENDPWMFHQANLRAYDGRRTLLGDLIDATFAKYKRLYRVPVVSPSMEELGARVAARMAYNAAGVSARIQPGRTITITADKAAVVAVTGLAGAGAETYAGQPIAWVSLAAGQSLTFPLDGSARIPALPAPGLPEPSLKLPPLPLARDYENAGHDMPAGSMLEILKRPQESPPDASKPGKPRDERPGRGKGRN